MVTWSMKQNKSMLVKEEVESETNKKGEQKSARESPIDYQISSGCD